MKMKSVLQYHLCNSSYDAQRLENKVRGKKNHFKSPEMTSLSYNWFETMMHFRQKLKLEEFEICAKLEQNYKNGKCIALHFFNFSAILVNFESTDLRMFSV